MPTSLSILFSPHSVKWLLHKTTSQIIILSYSDYYKLQNILLYELVLPWPVLNAITGSSVMILYRQSFKYIKVGDQFSYFCIQPEYPGQNLMIVSLLWSVIIIKQLNSQSRTLGDMI